MIAMIAKSTRRLCYTVVVAVGLSACSESADTQSVALEPAYSTSSNPELVECPSDTSYATSGTVLLLGGTIQTRGHSVVLPLGAVLLPTEISLAEPASQFMQIDLGANGNEHFQFRAPLTVTISYARCSRSNIDKGPLSVWLVDENGNLLQNMGGVDDKDARTITFQTDHFSGYAIAN